MKFREDFSSLAYSGITENHFAADVTDLSGDLELMNSQLGNQQPGPT